MTLRTLIAGTLLLGAGAADLRGQSSAQFQIPITVTNGTHTQTLTIGVSGDGDGGTIQDNTIGVDFDPSFGTYQELVAPPVPPQPYDFDARILTIPGRTPTFPTGLGGGVYKDFRGFFTAGQVDSFRINYTGDAIDAGPTTISWPASVAMYGTAWAIRPLSGSEWTPVDMLTTTSVVIPAGVLQKNALIIKTGVAPPTPVDVTFQVDMRMKLSEYSFRPDLGDFVTVRGSFNDWGNSTGNVDTLKDADNDSVYTLTRQVPGTVQISYRYWKSVRNGAGYESIADRLFAVPAGPATIPVVRFDNDSVLSVNARYGAGWDMISSPVIAPSDSVRALFPTSDLSYAFSFVPGAGYQQSFTMQPGTGYWGKFPSAGSSDIGGSFLFRDSIDVAAGWNMIGSVSLPVDTASILQVPAGIISSVYFGYNPGYAADSVIRPGRAYWVKARIAGHIVLQSTGPLPASTPGASPAAGSTDRLVALTVSDARGNVQDLFLVGTDAGDLDRFLMPPPPPEGTLNARFASQRMIEAVPAAKGGLPLTITTGAWPVTVSWEVKGECPGLAVRTGSGLRPLRGTGSAVLNDPSAASIAIEMTGAEVPAAFSLGQNYPNPFNPATTISYSLPVDGRVTVRIFDTLGRQVALLVDEVRPAGYHEVQWNGTNGAGQQVASGVYLYRLDVQPASGTASQSAVKSMLLLK